MDRRSIRLSYSDDPFDDGGGNSDGGSVHAADEEVEEVDEEVEEVEDVEVLSLAALTARVKRARRVDVGLRADGEVAAVWSVSSAKHSCGVANVVAWGRADTFWQSDGALPHTVTIELPRLTAVEQVCVCLDHAQDESYTPESILVRAGTYAGDIAEVAGGRVSRPHGWVILEVGSGGEGDGRVWCTRLEVVFLENHDNGRDCRVRGIRVLGPSVVSAFATEDFTQHLILR